MRVSGRVRDQSPLTLRFEQCPLFSSDLSPLLPLPQEVPTTASSYVDSALRPCYQLWSSHKDKLRPELVQQWLEGALSESTHR